MAGQPLKKATDGAPTGVGLARQSVPADVGSKGRCAGVGMARQVDFPPLLGWCRETSAADRRHGRGRRRGCKGWRGGSLGRWLAFRGGSWLTHTLTHQGWLAPDRNTGFALKTNPRLSDEMARRGAPLVRTPRAEQRVTATATASSATNVRQCSLLILMCSSSESELRVRSSPHRRPLSAFRTCALLQKAESVVF